jgi:hypothetical protein
MTALLRMTLALTCMRRDSIFWWYKNEIKLKIEKSSVTKPSPWQPQLPTLVQILLLGYFDFLSLVHTIKLAYFSLPLFLSPW